MLFKIDADYDTVEWYGNGPAETYWDRQHGAKLGIYQNKIADNMAQYLVPQECGAKTAVRWAKVVDRNHFREGHSNWDGCRDAPLHYDLID